MIFPNDCPHDMKQAIARLNRLISSSLAVRVGETSVVSTKVHMQDVRQPHTVQAIYKSDAGQTFYSRENPGEVIHIDIFHSPGNIDPIHLGDTLIKTLNSLRFKERSIAGMLSYIDIQTALGGGRLDGTLAYGKEEGVACAHRTHVHLTTLNSEEIMGSVFSIVGCVEYFIKKSGLELRKIRKVIMVQGTQKVDLSNYAASSDSMLRQRPKQSQGTGQGMYRQEALARQAAKDMGSATHARKLLEQIQEGLRPRDIMKMHMDKECSSENIGNFLSSSKLTRFDGQKYLLTQDGLLVLSYLKLHSEEIDSYLKRLLWCLPAGTKPAGEKKGTRVTSTQNRGRAQALVRSKNEPAGIISVPETVMARGLRMLKSPSTCGNKSFIQADMRYAYTLEKKGNPVVLLIDASASMAGKRIAAAKDMARHMLLTGKEKLCVAIFQDSDVKVVCKMTKNPKVLEAGLANIHAQGLTPLASGLEAALELSAKSMKKPLVLCITDGIPTVPSRTLSAIDDAITAAKNLARKGVRLGCIGLEPNKSFLRHMVSAARGTLYVVDELEASTLAAIARKERSE